MLDKVKIALRISHSKLDSDITETIAAARAELIRAGVAEDAANSDEMPLIVQAIKTYCLARYTEDLNQSAKYEESFQYQLDCLRKSTLYSAEV